jgi:2-dehydro-3-deoxyphosphogluconate aldolase/(4S)-4-hydroxy-2-oxoglutarate aldolase
MSNKQSTFDPVITSKIDETKIIAVLVIDKTEHAKPLTEALLRGGVDTIELTLRTDAALDAARIIKQDYPGVTLGIGTVLTNEQVKAVADVGVDFAVAPGCNPRVVEAAIDNNLSFAPGVMTPSDIELAVELGCNVLKYFPAESAGGLKHLKNMSSPYLHLGLKFIPLGGININNAGNYLGSPIVTALGGSWIAKRDMIREAQWEKITQNARQIRELINSSAGA